MSLRIALVLFLSLIVSYVNSDTNKPTDYEARVPKELLANFLRFDQNQYVETLFKTASVSFF